MSVQSAASLRTLRFKGGLTVRSSAMTLMTVAALLGACDALAEVDFKPYAAVEYAHNSNVFAQRQDLSSTGEERSDASLTYGAGLDVLGQFGRQQLTLSAKGSRERYQEFDQLDHDEYDASLQWDWKFARIFDGMLSYGQLQRMVPFADTQESTTDLLLEKGARGTAEVNVAVTPAWRVETQAVRTDFDSPRPGAPNLQQKETLVGAGLKYVGVARLSAGLEFTDTDGEVSGSPDTTDSEYKQKTAQFAANYEVSGKTSLAVSLGRTKREDDVQGDVSATTGALSYAHTLTRKTSVNVEVNRAVNSYLTQDGVQSELSTGADLGLTWRVTGKTSFGLTAGYHESKFPGQAASEIVDERKDDFVYAAFEINYQMLRRLLIRPFVRYEDRDSNDPTFVYDSKVAGVQIRATLR